MLQKSVPAWFEIPSKDLERAVRFYEKVIGAALARDEMGPMKMAVFPHEKPAPTGALVRAEGYEPAAAGSVVYLNLDDIRPALQRVAAAGGPVLLPLAELAGGMGGFGQDRDRDGDRRG